ncbi:uncharacterized protein LOC113871991 [Abrus precatorius]|uniref:Uncharacterized protein LOC113871991 n=1 Tax=Abrus precatorius TaxID=3816 RepID=A0A8B8MAU6_ABRPR|nr:uncharacterized protein LOC113871991 [Abrus precatorius]XP_027364937.1 uncharacterized protein LOC113871991 [Abrus precatorius]XP_027364944.1 uncharacterized protein LOC113871991 [Abrus precatorius]XP_027364953.1 uncharacterized protein LOC113871991 [Abrus precatorius]
MASAEKRTPYTANCFTQDCRIPLNSLDHPSSVSKKLVSDLASGNSISDQIHANSVSKLHNLNSDKLPNMKWWLHVKSELGGEVNYTSQHLNSYESELGAISTEFLDENVKSRGDQSVKDFDALSNFESANLSVEQPWHASPTCMKNNNTRMPKIETSLNTDLHFTPKKKDQGELCFSDSHFMDCDISGFLISELGKMTSSDLKSHLMEDEKIEPWWRTAGKDELASLVAQKSLEHIENCDLPHPQTKHIRQRPPYPKGVDNDKTQPSSFNHKTKTGSSLGDGYPSSTSFSGCSFQDANKHLSSDESKDSSSSNKGWQINSENSSMAELLKALCHSQTRAREAEKAAQRAYSEKEHILSLFFRQAAQLFAYKQWFHVLQLENLCLQLRNKNQPLLNLFPAYLPWNPCSGMLLKKARSRAKKINRRRCGIRKCAIAFAMGLGLAGAGLLLGWTMGWMFPPL